jgi:tellurite resistance protein
MEQHILGERGKALEDDFFRRQDAALLERRRGEAARTTARAALAAASRITDDALLDELVAMGITVDTLVALSLVPLAEVAWADGRLDAAEKRAVLEAARKAGLEPGSTGHRLVESCLAERPPAALRGLWRHYIESVCAALPADGRAGLKHELMRQARTVAEAAGGFKVLLSKVSAHEQALLEEIAGAFER